MSVLTEPSARGRAQQHPAAPAMERFSYDDKVVRAFTLMTLVWALVAFLAGLIIGFELVLPSAITFAENHGLLWLKNALAWIPLIPQASFGRLRPLHTNAAIFAFAGNAIFAGVYYSTQRLKKRGCGPTSSPGRTSGAGSSSSLPPHAHCLSELRRARSTQNSNGPSTS